MFGKLRRYLRLKAKAQEVCLSLQARLRGLPSGEAAPEHLVQSLAIALRSLRVTAKYGAIDLLRGGAGAELLITRCFSTEGCGLLCHALPS